MLKLPEIKDAPPPKWYKRVVQMVLSLNRPFRRDGIYYYRRCVPPDLQAVIGKREERISLKTREGRIARLRYLTVSPRVDARWRFLIDKPSTAACLRAKYLPLLLGDEPAVGTELAPISVPRPEVAVSVAEGSLSAVQLVELWARQTGPKPKTLKRWSGVMAKLMAFLGHDDILRVTEEDAERWRDHRQADGISPSTIAAADLAGPRTILNWAVSNRSLPIKHNPFLGVRIKVRKRTRLRERGFTLAEAETILKATVADHGPKISITGAAARRWVPWLAAYSGARVNELTQLRHEDIIEERSPDGESFWCMRITPESGTVKTDAARVVPLHPHVIEQGFLAYVDRRQNLPLFFEPSLARKAHAAHRQADKVGERLAAWVRTLGVPNGVQPNHGWRHRFRTIGRSLRIADSMMNAIDGHATESIADAYGDYVVKAMHEAISIYPKYTA